MGERQMTAAEAATAIAGVREYRQGLTGRAAGTVWIVWGMALAVFAAMDLFIPASQIAGNEVGDHEVYDLFEIWPAWLLMGLAIPFAACAASYAIWKAHAIVAEEQDRGVKGWASALGLAVAFLAGSIAALIGLEALWEQGTGDNLFETHSVFANPLWAGFVAVTLAFRLRRRVPMMPGLCAAGVMLAAQILVPLMVFGPMQQQVAQMAGYQAFLAIMAFTSVGLVYFHRG